MKKKKFIIGITGTIGSGKSTIAKMFRAKGAALLDADVLAHGCLKKTTQTYRKIKKAFGVAALNADKTINKKKLAEIVFDNKKSLRKLCGIIHPAVIKSIKEKIEKLPKKVVVIDAPLLIEAGMVKDVDVLVVVTASPEVCVKRAVKKLKISQREARERMKAQMPIKEKVKYADCVINNDGDLNIAKKKVEKIWKDLTGGN